MGMSPSLCTQTLTLIQSELSDYLEDPQTMDFQDFAGFFGDYMDESYTNKKFKVVYDFIARQQRNDYEVKDEENCEMDEIETNYFLKVIGQYAKGSDTSDIN